MALHGNRSVLLKSAGRFLNGGPAIMRSNFTRHGEVRNSYQVFADTAAIPYGYYGGRGAWVQPKKGGAVSGVNAIAVSLGASGAGSMGKNTSGTASITFDLSGVGGLISSASGVASISLGASGNIFASKSTSGTAGITLGATGTLKATGKIQGTAPISLSANWTPYAVGWISGSTASGGVLTEASIIAAMNANPPKVNIAKVNDVDVVGTGAPGSEWGPV